MMTERLFFSKNTNRAISFVKYFLVSWTNVHRFYEKQLLEGPTLKKFIAKTNWKKALKHIINRRAFAADYRKKKGNIFSILLICLLLLAINYSENN